MTDNITVKVIVSGKVQGVFFRAYTQKAAQEHLVTGYVKNLSDGCVEAVFQGGPERVQAMIQWCRQGSPMSSVSNVTTREASDHPHYSDFEITY